MVRGRCWGGYGGGVGVAWAGCAKDVQALGGRGGLTGGYLEEWLA